MEIIDSIKTSILEELGKTDVTIKFYAKNYSILTFFHVCTIENGPKHCPYTSVNVRTCLSTTV